jgi:hypothetical protein
LTDLSGAKEIMQLDCALNELLPTDEDVALYRERGYYISPKLFSEDEIDDAVYGSERFYAGERDFSLPSSVRPFEGWKPEDGDVPRINDYVSLQNLEISALVLHPLIGAIAARLNGSPSIRLWHDQMIYKKVDRSEKKFGIGWHTDRSYWQTCTSTEMLTAWIPFQDCDETMGPLTIIAGSHQWYGDKQLRGFHSSDLASWEQQFANEGREIEKVPMTLKKGQVSFHHCMAIHGSGPNQSTVPRLSISAHLQDEANRYRQVRNDSGEITWHRNDILCRSAQGQPDYTDPDFCPVLWTQD